MVEDVSLPEELQRKLDELSNLLQSNSVVKEFHAAQAEIEKDNSLKEKEEAMKQEQKEAVQAKHYDKENALHAAETKSDLLKEQIENDIKVVNYRESLAEANDLLQYITDYIQTNVNEEIDKKYREEEKKYHERRD